MQLKRFAGKKTKKNIPTYFSTARVKCTSSLCTLPMQDENQSDVYAIAVDVCTFVHYSYCVAIWTAGVVEYIVK